MRPEQAGDPENGRTAPMPPVTSQAGSGMPLNGDARMAPPFASPSMYAPARDQDTVSAEFDSGEMPWEGLEDDMGDAGIVEPAFAADVSAAEAALADLSRQSRKDEEFPLDAFIIPEQAQRLPTGLEGASHSEPAHTPVTELADRLEKLSHRLRVEDSDFVVARLAGGDRLDAMIAGLIAGILAASK